jgi:CRP-like cAMP-binding protein
MPELDAATLTERVLRLGRNSPLNHLTTAELDLLASAGREVVCTKRTVLVPAHERAPALYVPLTGRLRALRDGQPVSGDPVREFYGGTSLLGDGVLSADVVAEPGTVLFVLDRDAFLALLEEHGDLQRSLLRNLTRRVIESRGAELVTSGHRTVTVQTGLPSGDMLSRMRVLRDALGLQSRSLPVLARLARAAHVRQLTGGSAAWQNDGADASVVVVVQGALDVRLKGIVLRRVHPGEGLGMMEAVAAAPIAYEGIAVDQTTIVELSCAEMQEAIEDHDNFCQDLIRVVALELHQRMFGELVVAHA